MYLDYDEYRAMGGTLEETTFYRFAIGAEQAIRRHTFRRIDAMLAVPEGVKGLMLELVERSAKQAEAAGLSSETVGSWSKSYAAQEESERQKSMDALILDYLAAEVDDKGVPLLYLGVDV